MIGTSSGMLKQPEREVPPTDAGQRLGRSGLMQHIRAGIRVQNPTHIDSAIQIKHALPLMGDLTFCGGRNKAGGPTTGAFASHCDARCGAFVPAVPLTKGTGVPSPALRNARQFNLGGES